MRIPINSTSYPDNTAVQGDSLWTFQLATENVGNDTYYEVKIIDLFLLPLVTLNIGTGINPDNSTRNISFGDNFYGSPEKREHFHSKDMFVKLVAGESKTNYEWRLAIEIFVHGTTGEQTFENIL